MKSNGALVKQLVREVIVCTDKHVDHNLGEIVFKGAIRQDVEITFADTFAGLHSPSHQLIGGSL